MELNFFSIAGLTLATTTFLLTFILLIYGRSQLHRIWALFNFVVGLWGIGAFYVGFLHDPAKALSVWRILYLPIIFIPILNYHVVYLLCNLYQPRILRFIYVQGIIFSFLTLFFPFFISSVKYVFNSFYYDVPGFAFYPFFLVWMLIVGYAHYYLFLTLLKAKGRLRNQILYFFVGTALGFMGGITNFLPALGLNWYPIGNFTIPIYCLIVSYAILRYRLLDVNVAITRTGIFVAVYGLVLGLPFVLAFGFRDKLIELVGPNWWMIPFVTLAVLATVGPSIYLYIQKKAEDRLLQEQRRYQTTLRQASLGMGRIKDLRRLLNLIVHVVTRIVRIEHCEIFLFHEDSSQYVLKASKGKGRSENDEGILSAESGLVRYLNKTKEPVVYEEMKQRNQDYHDAEIAAIEENLRNLKGELAVPSFIEDKLIAIIFLGKKRSGKLYSEDDLAVFSILANQSALAIENAQFYEDMKKTHEQLVKTEKMATVGTMADGLSHQINNRLHAMGFIAGDALDALRLKKDMRLSKEAKVLFEELDYALGRIEQNVKQGSDIVEGLLKYTRKGEQGLSAVDLNKLLDAAIEMVQYKIKLTDMKIVRNFNGNVAKIKGNFTQLQEVLFNLLDNAYDAMMQRKSELKEPNYQPTLQIDAEISGRNLEILFRDNGMGVKEEDIKKLFTPFFTTKLSSKKGTGLGLYVIRQIIEENHGGRIHFSSIYQEGTQFRMVLPIMFEENQRKE